MSSLQSNFQILPFIQRVFLRVCSAQLPSLLPMYSFPAFCWLYHCLCRYCVSWAVCAGSACEFVVVSLTVSLVKAPLLQCCSCCPSIMSRWHSLSPLIHCFRLFHCYDNRCRCGRGCRLFVAPSMFSHSRWVSVMAGHVGSRRRRNICSRGLVTTVARAFLPPCPTQPQHRVCCLSVPWF